MFRKFFVKAALVIMGVAALQACAATYDDRMKHLDDVTARGITYRTQLQKQGTPPSREACAAGWVLLQDKVPWDIDGGLTSEAWTKQVEEAYVKSCMTGQPRPKPDPSGIGAVTAVPHSSTSSAPATP